VLAYLFWHRARPEVSRERYETALAAFHRALADDPPAGFRESAVFRATGLPWAGDYEDWYLVNDWPALGELNEAAVSGSRRAPHDAAAALAAEGAGGVYGLVRGAAKLGGALSASWLEKDRGEPYADFHERAGALAPGVGGSLWQRQLVLGPGREFCLLAPQRPSGVEELGPLTIALDRAG
jgi:hypothetical protein